MTEFNTDEFDKLILKERGQKVLGPTVDIWKPLPRGKRHAYTGKPLKPCGTYAAAVRHQRRHEPLCEPCKAARREWNTAMRRVQRAAKGYVLSEKRKAMLKPCGTPAAARRHYRHNEPLDPACRTAIAKVDHETYLRRYKGAK